MWRRSLLALIALAFMTGAAALAARAITPASVITLIWSMPLAKFGGWSGIDVTPDGKDFVAVSDRGSIAFGSLHRVEGRLEGISSMPLRPIKGDKDLWSTTFARDAEGVSLEPSGALLISYEGFARVWRHRDPALPERIHQHSAFQRMPANGSLEAVAAAPDGTIYTLPEVSREPDRYPVFAHDGTGWSQPFSLQRSESWRAVGADFGPDGLFYLLERQFLGIGFVSRIRRFDISAPGAQPLAGELLYQSPLWRHGNLEGIAIWRDEEGQIRAVLVSDNNFLPFLPTEIVEIVLPG